MINFHKHRAKIVILASVFVVAWAVWTLVLQPMSETRAIEGDVPPAAPALNP